MSLSRLCVLTLALALTPGCLLIDVTTPLDQDLQATQLGDKQGESSFQSVLWLVAWGDAGSNAAAEEGGITTLRHMDQHTLSVLFGLYYCNTTIVYGD